MSRLTKKIGIGYQYGNALIDGRSVVGMPIQKLGQLEDIEEELGIGLTTLIGLLNIQEKLITIYTKDSPKSKKINAVETRLIIDILNKRAVELIYLASRTWDTVVVKKPSERNYYYPFSEYGTYWALTREELECHK